MADMLEKNLAALRGRDAATAERLAGATAHEGVSFFDALREERAISATISVKGEDGTERRVTLASRHTPVAEAKRFADQADLKEHGCIVMMGVGVGHHVAELAERVRGRGLLVAYEPDERLLRAVMERVDCVKWMGAEDVMVFTGEVELAEITRRLESQVAHVAAGVQILTYGPTRQLQGERLGKFGTSLTQFVAYCRTNVATTLVNSAATCRNYANNLAYYAAGAGLEDLRDAAKGYLAVLVSAGPSLAKNVHLLAQPGVRDRVVVIAVQTVLKPLLERGVKPHFVTALDYHEISRRFYEGIDAKDLEGVTLVAEPKAHCAILDSFGGAVRVCRSSFLDLLLGPLARPMAGLRSGSTVAHLSLYLAQFLGCDPIAMIGQDLGFSDGLYYCPGTAIHEVWSTELSAFNTLEMMEWKRIARHKTHLKKVRDVHDRPIYTDEQMLTYLRQFERDFAQSEQTIIDATEGGVAKERTLRMGLGEVLEKYATRTLPVLPMPGDTPPAEAGGPRGSGAGGAGRLREVAAHLEGRMRQVRELKVTSERTVPLLKEMIGHQRDARKMDALFGKLEKKQKRVAELREAFALVNELNQIGAFKRRQADRSISVDEKADPYEKQKRQLERDLVNLKWLIEGCDETLSLFDQAAGRLNVRLEPPCSRGGLNEGVTP
ncbi:MAG: motility associated factor glycosyltransferase family protein [Phycisphaerales bacterium]